MINNIICQTIGNGSAYQCGIQLLKMQLIPLLLLVYVPYLLFTLLFIANSNFKRNAFSILMLVIGLPFLISVILFFAFPYLIMLI
jgi:hypothetical protein